MSISGISTASAASYILQAPGTTPATTTGSAPQTIPVTPVVQGQPAASAQPSGTVHHHHHHGGGETSGQSSDVTQSGTATGANVLNTLA